MAATSPDVGATHLTRPDPDSILADDADPDTLLGNESDSESGASRRASRIGGSGGDDDNEVSFADAEDGEAAATHEVSLDASTDTQRPPFVGLQGTSDDALMATPKVNGNHSTMASLASPITGTPTQATFQTPTRGSSMAAPKESDAEVVVRLRAELEELSGQVISLNGKLVASYEQRSDLEDDLSEAHARIMAHTTRIAELEKERQEHLAALNTGLLVEKAHVSNEMQKMMERVIEETAQRGKAVSDKEKIESELDELSASLFNEANAMVASERLLRARAEEKSKQMEERLKDTEGIMLEQQKILGDLQRRVESGSSPAEGAREALPAGAAQPSSASSSDSQLLLNIVPYQELRAFLAHLRKLRLQLAPFYNYPLPQPGQAPKSPDPGASAAAAASRSASPAPTLVTSGLGGISAGLGGVASGIALAQGLTSNAPSSSSASPFAIAGVGRHRDYPTLPANAESLVHIPSQLSLPFLKRAQEEDSDPCLRLDFAPGLNWLSRRTANTAILEGTLMIEPVFPGGSCPDEEAVRRANSQLPPAACAMCGISIVNVPLPGGGHAESSSASSTAASTAAGWISAAGQSLGNVATSPGGPGKEAPRSRSGLFSTLRSMGASPKPTTASTPSAPSVVIPGGADTATATESDQPLPDSPQPFNSRAPLPVPTHIFRLSETSSARYLLCPHHCLARLRAACAFWGYLRSIERAVVLEGKLAWDDAPATADAASQQPTLSASAPPPLPPRSPAAVSPLATVPATTAATLEAQVEAEAEASEGQSKDGEAKSTTQEESKEKTGDAEEKKEDAEEKSDDEDGFADAVSLPASPVQEKATLAVSTEGVAGDSTPVTPTSPALARAALDVSEPSSPKPTAPPLPKRSTARSRPVPPPPVQAGEAAAALQRVVTPGPPPRAELPAKGGEGLSWEERVYQEVMELKRAMFLARAGLQPQPQ